MTPVDWTAILALVGGAVDIAIRVAQAIRGCGGQVNGCPVEIEETLGAADIPTGEATLDARARAVARSLGLDARGIAERRGEDDPYESNR